jgi:hypothetical protein
MVALILAAAGVASVAAGCGGSSKSSTTTATTSTGAHRTTKSKHASTKGPSPFQQLLVKGKGAQAASSVKVNPGQIVTIVVHVPSTVAGKKVTIAVDQTTPTTFTVTSAVAGAALKGTGQITASSPGLQISDVHWACKYPTTFCPLTVLSSSSTHVKLSAKASSIPVTLTALFNHPGAGRSPRLISLGPPAPEASVQAKLLLAVPPRTKGSKPTPGTSVTASPGSVVRVRVQPVPGSPAHATLTIAIPHTSGSTITVQAGGTSSQPSSTATINSSSGSLRISGVAWRCALPPGTFCPLSSVKTTSTGLEISVPTPRVPVTLTLITAKA